jgi:hypothetical protein
MAEERKPIHIMLPPELHAELKALATRERRSMMAEATFAIEHYLHGGPSIGPEPAAEVWVPLVPEAKA